MSLNLNSRYFGPGINFLGQTTWSGRLLTQSFPGPCTCRDPGHNRSRSKAHSRKVHKTRSAPHGGLRGSPPQSAHLLLPMCHSPPHSPLKPRVCLPLLRGMRVPESSCSVGLTPQERRRSPQPALDDDSGPAGRDLCCLSQRSGECLLSQHNLTRPDAYPPCRRAQSRACRGRPGNT